MGKIYTRSQTKTAPKPHADAFFCYIVDHFALRAIPTQNLLNPEKKSKVVLKFLKSTD